MLLSTLTYKRRIIQVLLDMAVISTAYYLAFALRFEFHLNELALNLLLQSMPIIVIGTYGALFLFGSYRGLWRYTDLEDLVHIAKTVACGALLSTAGLFLLYGVNGFSRMVMIVYAVLLFIGIAGSRLSFRLFAIFIHLPRKHKVPVLIYGAGDGGEVVLRECRKNADVEYRPVGFLDDDPAKQGRTVAGVPVLGGADRLPEILSNESIEGCIVSSAKIFANGKGEVLRKYCDENGLWLRQLRLEFVEEGTI